MVRGFDYTETHHWHDHFARGQIVRAKLCFEFLVTLKLQESGIEVIPEIENLQKLRRGRPFGRGEVIYKKVVVV